MNMKKILVLGGGGFIGGHLAKELKSKGSHVRIADRKKHEYFPHHEICDEFIQCDLRNQSAVEIVISEDIDEIYQLAADMGGCWIYFYRPK